MDEVLTTNVAALASAGAISLERVAQDGMRVRADAGAASFRRQASLAQHVAEPGELVKDIKRRAATDPAAASRRAQAARERAAQEREERIRAALAQQPQVQAAKRRNGDKPEDARVSTTDADARVMKMGDGGFRPTFNVQLASTCEDQGIVGVDVSNAGSDMGQRGRRRLRGGGAVALAPSRRPGQGRVQAARRHGRVRQRAGAQPGVAAHAGARAAQGTRAGVPVRAGAQPDAHGQDRAAVDRLGRRCVRSGPDGRVKGARNQK